MLKEYCHLFERIYLVSPTATIDEAYREIMKHVETELKADNNTEQYLLDEHNPEALQNVTDTQHKIIDYQKQED